PWRAAAGGAGGVACAGGRAGAAAGVRGTDQLRELPHGGLLRGRPAARRLVERLRQAAPLDRVRAPRTAGGGGPGGPRLPHLAGERRERARLDPSGPHGAGTGELRPDRGAGGAALRGTAPWAAAGGAGPDPHGAAHPRAAGERPAERAEAAAGGAARHRVMAGPLARSAGGRDIPAVRERGGTGRRAGLRILWG